MPRLIPDTDRALILQRIAEGAAMRSIQRETGYSMKGIMNLSRRLGQGCKAFMDYVMVDLAIRRVEVDETWTFVYQKQERVDPKKPKGFDGEGSYYIFIAVDPDSCLVPSYWIGQQTLYDAQCFLEDLAPRLANRIQMSSDQLVAYAEAAERAFGSSEIDYGTCVKTFKSKNKPLNPGVRITGKGRSGVARIDRNTVYGKPIFKEISTSHVDAFHRTLRHLNRRMVRATCAFSKTKAGLDASLAITLAYYNFCLTTEARKLTPAMEAGISDQILEPIDLIEGITELGYR